MRGNEDGGVVAAFGLHMCGGGGRAVFRVADEDVAAMTSGYAAGPDGGGARCRGLKVEGDVGKRVEVVAWEGKLVLYSGQQRCSKASSPSVYNGSLLERHKVFIASK